MRIKYKYSTLTIHLCMFVIVTDKLPPCLLVRQILHDIKSVRQTASLETCRFFSGHISNRVGFFSFILHKTGIALSNFCISKPKEIGRKHVTFLLKTCASGQEMYRTTFLKSVPGTEVHLTSPAPLTPLCTCFLHQSPISPFHCLLALLFISKH